MKEIDSKTVKQIQLNILKAVHEFCESNGITYYMSYGTLLGAVRHGGYIPWDDDIDITMPYPDYIRFCQMFQSNIYKVNVWFKQPDFYCNFAKIEDKRTLQIEQVDSKWQIGINIDVTPLIGLPDDEKKAKSLYKRILFFRDILHLKQLTIRKGRRIDKQLITILSKGVTSFISYKTINIIIDKLSKRYDYTSAKYVVCVGSFNPISEIFEKKKLGDTIRIPFEDNKFCAPCGYDAWLTQIFGNYMELPPIEKQVTHHSFNAYWREEKVDDTNN